MNKTKEADLDFFFIKKNNFNLKKNPDSCSDEMCTHRENLQGTDVIKVNEVFQSAPGRTTG